MIAIGADHGGYKLKEEIKRYLDEKEIKYIDVGTFSEERTDYPIYAERVAKRARFDLRIHFSRFVRCKAYFGRSRGNVFR